MKRTSRTLRPRGRREEALRNIADADLEATLRRGDEDEKAWHARLDLLREGTAYRSVDVDRARLLDLAGDPRADPTARVAACSLLTRVVDAEEREAVDLLRNATAHPRVRVAMEALEEVEVSGMDATREEQVRKAE